MNNFNVKDFKQMLSKMNDLELKTQKQNLQDMLVCMISNPTIGKQLTLVELEIAKRKQVKK